MDERMRVLRLLEQGSITADEAARLLAAVGRGEGADEAAQPGDGRRPDGGGRRFGGGEFGGGNGPQGGHGRGDVNDFAEDMRRKFDQLAKDMTPKLQKLTEVVVEKTAVAAEQLSKSFDERRRGGWQAGHSPAYGQAGQDAHAHGSVLERAFEIPVTSGGGELAIAGLNGSVAVRGYNGDKITAKVTYKPRTPGAELNFAAYGDKYMLAWDDGDFKYISVDAYVPENLFDNIGISTSNGALTVSGLRAANIRLDSCNAGINASAIAADRLILETTNAGIQLSRAEAGKASVETTNAAIRIEDADIGELNASGTNGGLHISATRLERFNDYVWTLETSNGKLSANLPSGGVAYHIKAHASLSNVRIGLGGVSFIQDGRYAQEAVTPGFEGAARKMRLVAETSNGPLQIN